MRRRKLTGTLHPALEDEIWAGTPSRWRTGTRTRWQWETDEMKWRLGYAALRAFTEREGHARPTTTHRETLPDTAVNVGQWVAVQRHQRRHGRLGDARAAALEQLDGWAWDGDVGGTRAYEEPIDLPAGLAHGSAGAVSRGCKCQECLTARRAKERAWLAAQRTRKAAAGVPATRAPPAPAAPRAAAAARGRAVQRGQERVDAAPTWALVHDLQQRGFTLGWIGRELGYVRSLQLDAKTITRRIADQVTELHEAVGDLHAPSHHTTQMVPPLAELKTRNAA